MFVVCSYHFNYVKDKFVIDKCKLCQASGYIELPIAGKFQTPYQITLSIIKYANKNGHIIDTFCPNEWPDIARYAIYLVDENGIIHQHTVRLIDLAD